MFGNTKPFGTTSAFGTSTFGSTTTPFGQGSTTFGAKPTTGNVFGGSSFGATAQPSGLFGSTTPSTGTSLFGQSSTAFGQPASTTGVFGAASTSGGLFGTTTPATQPSTGLFGGSSTSAFGAPRPTFGGFGTTGSGLFGQNTSTGTGLFGSTTGFGATATNGTTIKFNPPTGTDTMMKGGVSQSISTRHQCITCMKEYENKSLEELRLEDYLANRKGPQSGTIGGFGTTQQTPGLFGTPAASTSAFSFGTTQAKPLFGTTGGTTAFGSTGTSMFGQTTQPQTGLFGKPVGFGTPTTSTTSGFAFGNTSGSSLFGQSNQPKPLFGQPTTGTGLFGQPAATQASTGFGTGTGFGGFGTTSQPATGLFGAKPTGFGTTNTTTTSSFNFGGTSTGGGLFGQKSTAPAFGTSTGFGTTTGFGSFGSTQTAGTGLFGQTKPATTGFGTTGNAFGTGLGTGFGTSAFSNTGLNTSTGTGLFGSTLGNKSTGFGFGTTGGTSAFNFGQPAATGPTFGFGAAAPFGTSNDPNAAAILQQQQLQAQQIFAFTTNPFGDSPLFRNALRDSKHREEILKPTNPAAQKAVLTSNQFKVSPLPAFKLKTKPITPVPNGKVSLFDGLEDEDSSLSNATFVPKRSIKKLVLKTSQPSTPSFTMISNILSSPNRPTEINFSASIRLRSESPESPVGQRRNSRSSPLTIDVHERTSPEIILPRDSVESPTSSPLTRDRTYIPRHISDMNSASPSHLNDTIEALYTKNPKHKSSYTEKETIISDDNVSSSVNPSTPQDDEEYFPVGDQIHVSHLQCGVKLSRPGYYTKPPLNILESLVDENGNCLVENFTVGREGYGKVAFSGFTNVANLNLDDIVHFRRKEITVYPDDSNKPPQGQGLNKEADITLDCVWPTDKTTHLPIKDPDRLAVMGYREKIEKSTARLGAKFIDYIPETGSWVFQVEHFSKYGLEESDDESDMQVVKPKQPVGTNKVLALNGKESVSSEITSNTVLKKLRTSTAAAVADDDDEMQDADMLENENIFSPLQQLVTARVDSAKIQGMKASFFFDDVEENWALPHSARIQEIIPEFSLQKPSDAYIKPIPVKKTVHSLDKDRFMRHQYSFFEEPVTPLLPAAEGHGM